MIRRYVQNKIGLLLSALGLLAVSAGTAHADAHSYASERRQVKACVLVTNAAPGVGGGPENVTPHVFYILDRRTDLKPGGWEFTNPLAGSTITGDMYTRWQTRGGANDPAFANTAQGVAFRPGQPLTKNFGAYWEVNLDNISPDDLQQFDIVLMAYHNGSTQFSSDEREKIRRYVDGGGTVWLEDEGGFNLQNGGNYGGGQFIVDLGFATTIPTTSLPTPATQHHPLINFPYALAQTDILSLGAAGVQYDNTAYTHHAHQGLNNTFTGVAGLANPRVLVPVIWAGTAGGQLPYISAGDYGAGHIIVSSGGVASGINNYVGGVDIGEGGNSATISGEATLGARPVDMKFAYNIIAWTSSVPTGGVNSRRVGSTREDVGSQLGTRFATVPPASAPASQGSGAVMHKGVIFYVDGANVLHAYDASPQQDLDNDGNNDDGIRDYIYGAPYDEIWNTPLNVTGRVSTPTIASVVNPVSGTPMDIVMVTTSQGTTLAFNAFPGAGGVLATTSPLMWQVASPGSADLATELTALNGIQQSPGPAFADGVLFTLWNQDANDPNHPWHIAAIDPLTGLEIFQETNNIAATVAPSALAPGVLTGTVPGLPAPVGSLTTGYVRDSATGALDLMVYVPTRTEQTNDTGAATVQGVWFSTKNEPLVQFLDAGNNAVLGKFTPKGLRRQVPWYLTAPPAGGVNLQPVVYKHSITGVTTRLRYLTDFRVTYDGAPAGAVVEVLTLFAPTDTFTVDYTLDWPADNLQIINGSTRPSPAQMRLFSHRSFTVSKDSRQIANAPATHLLGAPALSTQDYLFTAGGDYPAGDRIFAFHEQFGTSLRANSTTATQPNTQLAWMFYPNGPDDDFNIGTGGLAGRFQNADTFYPPKATGLPAIPQVFVTDYEQVGAPAYSNGVVYVTGYCHLRSENGAPAGLPDGLVIIALRAHPDTTFSVPAGSVNGSVILSQPDLVNSTALNSKSLTLQEGVNFTVNRTDNTIHIHDFRVSPGAPGSDAFNTALPITILSGSNQAGGNQNGTGIAGTVVVNPQTGFGPLDNVLWWMTVPLQFSGGLYNSLPYPAVWSGSNPGGVSGLHPASGPSIIGNSLYFGSTTGQVVSVDISGINPNGGQVNVYKDDGTSRVVAQAAIKSTTGANVGLAIQQPIASPPVATTGIVAVGTPQGLVALDNQLTLIADNNRLIEVDYAGRVAWTSDGTQAYRLPQDVNGSASQAATLKVPIQRPNMAHRSSLNDFVIADTGNNRVLQMDKGGIVTWELSRLKNDLRFLRDNDPVVLNQPTDVQTFSTTGTGTLTFTSPVSGATYTYTPGAGGLWFATHYLIADSGNFRALEVVDVYDVNGNPVQMAGSDGTNPTMLRQVVFTTKTYAEQNKALRYRTIQQFQNLEGGVFRTYMVAAVDNLQQGADLNPLAANVGTNPTNVNGPGSSLMVIKRYPPAGQGNDGDTAALINSMVYVNGNTILRRQTISNPRWFKEFNVANPANLTAPILHYALADANGVYVLRPGAGPLLGEAVVEWALSNDDYFYMTGRHLNATSIQKLDQSDYNAATNTFYPHYLITNGYTGRDNILELFGNPGNILNGDVHGEVVEVRSDYYTSLGGYRNATSRLYQVNGGVLSANPASAIVWMTPKETIPALPASPTNPIPNVIKRAIGVGTNGTSTSLLEQPTFSDRPF